MIYARRRHERQSRTKRRDITRARSAGIAAAYDPTAMAPYATAFGIRPYGQKHCMPPAKTLYAIGKIIVCHGRKHSMPRAETSDDKSRSVGMQRRMPASPHFTYATSWLIKNKGGGFSLHPVIPPMWSIFFLYVCEPTPRCYRPICLHRADRDKQSGILQHFVIKQLATLQRSLPVAMHRGQAV